MIAQIMRAVLLASATAANRDERIRVLDSGGASRLVEALQKAYPQARSGDDYFKELTRAIETRKQVEKAGLKAGAETMAADAALGKDMREAASASGAKDPEKLLQQAIASAAKGKKGQWPPFFSLSEAGGYFFDSGKATLRPEFEKNLRNESVPMLKRNVDDYDVDVVEVIGHTDEVPMSGQSNLDTNLIQASVDKVPIANLRSTDNAGLAMARAVAVVRILRSDKRLAGLTILPLSGAQMIVPTDRMADGTARGSNQQRRRIEIRLRKSTQQASAVLAK